MRNFQPHLPRYQRRLAFERCEPRLTLSGDGGYILFDVGDYLSLDGNSFLITSGTLAVDSDFVDTLPRTGRDNLSYTDARDSDVPLSPNFWVQAFHNYLSAGGEIKLDLVDRHGVHHQKTIGEIELSQGDIRDIIEDHLLGDPGATDAELFGEPYEPARLAPGIVRSSPSQSALGDARLSSEFVASMPLHDVADAEVAANLALPPITAEAALRMAQEVEFKPVGNSPDAASEEGGTIEIGQLVAETQQAYESQLFAEAATQLESERTLADAAAPTEPLVGELARAVVFELVGQESATEAATQQPESAPNAALPDAADPEAAPVLGAKTEREEDTESHALAFSQWPLYFSAVLGGVIVARRRQSKPEVKQLPTRRR